MAEEGTWAVLRGHTQKRCVCIASTPILWLGVSRVVYLAGRERGTEPSPWPERGGGYGPAECWRSLPRCFPGL